MRVQITFTVDVDAPAWSAEYPSAGLSATPAELREDVRSYFASLLLCCSAVDEGLCDVTVRR